MNSKGMMTPGLEFQKLTTRFNVVHANFCAAHTVSEAGFNVIDLHYYSLFQTFRRNRYVGDFHVKQSDTEIF